MVPLQQQTWVKGVKSLWENSALVVGFGLLVLWLLLFNQLRVEWSINPQYSYGWLMPLLGFYLLVRRWEDRPEPSELRAKGAVVLTQGCLLGACFLLLPGRLLQEANPDWRLVSWFLAGCVVMITLGTLYLTGGKRWLVHFSFPFLFMLLAVPWPTVQEQAVVQWMMQVVTRVSVEALNWCGLFATQQGNLINLPNGVVGVDEACSGVRSFQSTLMASLFIGELLKLTASRRVLLLVFSLVLSFFLNSLRAFTLAFLHAEQGAELLQRLHDPAGYTILLISFGCLLALGWKLAPTAASAKEAATEASGSERKQFKLLAPRRLWFVVLGWLVLSEVTTELWYGSHERKWEQKVAWELTWPEVSESFDFRVIPENVQRILRYSEGRQGVIKKGAGMEWSIFEFVWKPGRVSAQLARSHSPEVCMPAAGAQLVAQKEQELWEVGSLKLPVQRYTFKLGSRVWQVYYIVWEDRAEREILERPTDFYRYDTRFEAVWAGRRHLGQRVVQVITSGGGEENAELVRAYLGTHIVVK